MSNLDPVPRVDEKTASIEEGKSSIEAHELREVATKPFPEEVKSRMKEWALSILSPTLVIVRVTVVFILAILADYLIIMIISLAFGSTVNHNLFAAKLLEGIQLLSVLGTALAYILYLVRALFRDLQETRASIKGDKEKSS